MHDGITEQVLFAVGNFNSDGIFQGPCQGDSGGPLYIDGEVTENGDVKGRTLVGGEGCGKLNYPKWFISVHI